MKLVVGLGNPGAAYEGSPHNVGFAAADVLARRVNASFRESSRFRAAVAKGVLAGEPVAVMKPLTYMNASGEAVGAWIRWNRLTVADLVVVLDDVDLELGRLRIRQRGGSGGHKGLASVVLHAGSDAFVRVRLGVGRGMAAPGEDVVAHVLRPFRGAQLETATAMAERAADAVEAMIEFGVERAMNRYNTVAAAGEKTE